MGVADVVIVGAGLAGMTAAHELRDLDLTVIESARRVGGRTLSGEHRGYWYNSGAQFVWDARTLALCADLGLEVIGGDGARAAIFLRGRLVEASNPYVLLLKMPLSIREKIDFGRTIRRLRRLVDELPSLDRPALDAQSLEDLMGPVTPITREIFDNVTENGAGLGIAEVSGRIGLAYAIHLFGGDVNSTLKAVRGGTQAITQSVAARLDPERLVLGAAVTSVSTADGEVAVTYQRPGGALETLRARRCIMAAPAQAVLGIVPDLPPAKRAALERMQPYIEGLNVAWMTDETGPMPWDRLLAVPVLGASFELFSNNAFFARRRGARRKPGGTFVTLSISSGKAKSFSEMSDSEIRAAQRADLKRMFPSAADVLDRAGTRIERWRALPRFYRGWLADRGALRAPFGNIHFCGDYTAQPGTPGAVGSGHHAAAAVRSALAGEPAIKT